MTLNGIRKVFNRKSEGTISKRAELPPNIFQLKKSMIRLVPGILETAALNKASPYTISFATDRNVSYLTKELLRLRNNGLEFDYWVDNDILSGEDQAGMNLTRSAIQKRLYITFSPASDEDWAYIRGLFGVNSKLTDEVSKEETFNTVGDSE